MVKPSGIIGILTDFGNKDNYVGVMKGVILSINKDSTLVDITNEIPPHNVRSAAFQLYTSYRYFPKGTVFLCVVDPGVGTERRALAVKTKNYFFVAPDNGLLYPSIVEDGVDIIVKLENKKYFLERISSTFHGRDIFAPVSAWISLGTPLEEFGSKLNIEDIVKIELKDYIRSENEIVGEVNYVDRFGNIVTSIPNKEFNKLPSKISLVTKKEFEAKKAKTYGEGRKNEILVIEGSHGFIEIAMNQESASKKLDLREGDRFKIRFHHHF